MLLGIQGRVTFLVIVATSASALLVARMLTARATEVLREHEIVDLGDEAMLRGWEILDRIDGLRDNLYAIAYSEELDSAVAEGLPAKELELIARRLCRRNWSEHLRIDLISFDDGPPSARPLVERATVEASELWIPDPWSVAEVLLSPIQRLEVLHEMVPGGFARPEPVISGLARLGAWREEDEGPEVFVRIVASLHFPDSPRHLFALTDAKGQPIVRPDEAAPEDGGNDAVFLELGRDRRLLSALEQRRAASEDPANTREEQKIERIVRSDSVPLDEPFYFQEGKPGKKLAEALSALSESQLDAFLEDMQARLGRSVRIGGMLSGVREIRLLGHNRAELVDVRETIVAELSDRFGSAYDDIAWRNIVVCGEIHSWAVRFLVEEGGHRSEYLLHYAVFDDELASSIEYEMLSLQSISLLVAGGFGLLGFFLAMRFIRPLKEMTVTAQRITESPPETLLRELSALAQQLDLRRRDEVGEIARASKRLFEELIAFQAELEERVHDRTLELRRTNLELEQANEKLKSISYEKDAFVAKVSHDLRQPLNAIFLQVEALGLSDLDESQRKDLQRIRDHAARELNLVNDILEYQKIIMGAESLERDTIEIESVLKDLAETHRNALGGRDVALLVETPADVGSFVADDRRLRQVLGNLLGNACKFTKEGSVSLGAQAREIDGEDWIEFTVSDTGRGMSPGEQSRAFIPFVSNKKDNAGGTGLGLAICRELVGQMGGRIGFVSELGNGTQFSVLLPRIAPAETGAIAGADDSLPQAPPGTGKAIGMAEVEGGGATECATVLVIDDDPRVRDFIRRILEQQGHRVVAAADGAEGIELAERHRPDAITLDVVMPGGMDGWQVLRQLKESPATQSIPVIMVSVMAEAGKGLALEVEDYLTKPVDVERLVRSVHRATRSQHRRNLLLVDDDPGSLGAMVRLLEATGWSATTAADGTEALDVLERTLPAAVILDLLMPGMDGFEFLRRLRADPRWRSLPVIVMTGKNPDETERAFLRDRVAAVLQKGSAGGSELLAAVTDLLQRETRT